MTWWRKVYPGTSKIQLKIPKKKIIPVRNDNKKVYPGLLPPMATRRGVRPIQTKNGWSSGGKPAQSSMPLTIAEMIVIFRFNQTITHPFILPHSKREIYIFPLSKRGAGGFYTASDKSKHTPLPPASSW
jgi:hypothetical protein